MKHKQKVITPAISRCHCGSPAKALDWDYNDQWKVLCDDNNHTLTRDCGSRHRAICLWNNRVAAHHEQTKVIVPAKAMVTKMIEEKHNELEKEFNRLNRLALTCREQIKEDPTWEHNDFQEEQAVQAEMEAKVIREALLMLEHIMVDI